MTLTICGIQNKYIFDDYQKEKLEGDVILFASAQNKVLSLNRTAALIWSLLEIANKQNIKLTDNKIAHILFNFYEHENIQIETVLNDVISVLNLLINESILVIQND